MYFTVRDLNSNEYNLRDFPLWKWDSFQWIRVLSVLRRHLTRMLASARHVADVIQGGLGCSLLGVHWAGCNPWSPVPAAWCDSLRRLDRVWLGVDSIRGMGARGWVLKDGETLDHILNCSEFDRVNLNAKFVRKLHWD